MNCSNVLNIAFAALIAGSDFVILALAVNGIARIIDRDIAFGIIFLVLAIVAAVVLTRALAYIDIKLFGDSDID